MEGFISRLSGGILEENITESRKDAELRFVGWVKQSLTQHEYISSFVVKYMFYEVLRALEAVILMLGSDIEKSKLSLR